ncbi:hypothetical protein CROQUDRAFT_48224 [Cronartium quercuum f. sp. fusiforme G11]|uniref:Cutinase n=1 Tax=Cronartium quercuum f. sp. fusiforme G11 TaxID=708437 RepID=A0A9P6NHS2_9BASI|nr:hypothetical protein CROQUDRAFT_48224 [Cronartium quercuum f. sp. fusiforme G11]
MQGRGAGAGGAQAGGAGKTPNSGKMAMPGDGGAGCSKYVIVSARGTGENQLNPTGNRNVVKGVMSQVPGGSNYEVKYPATTDYINGPVQGAADANRYLAGQKTKCPGQKVLLVGYSEGAMVVVRTLQKIAVPESQVVGAVMFGNPFWKAKMPYNKGTATTGQGSASVQGVTVPKQFSNRVFDVCNTGDVVCTSAGGMAAHMNYPSTAAGKEAVTWAASKVKGVGGTEKAVAGGEKADSGKGHAGAPAGPRGGAGGPAGGGSGGNTGKSAGQEAKKNTGAGH